MNFLCISLFFDLLFCCFFDEICGRHFWSTIRPKKKNCYVALSRPTVKCEKTGSFFCCCWKCQIWAKNLLKFVFNGLKSTCICVLTAFRPSFPHLETLKKILKKKNSLTVGKKKKKKKKNWPTDRPNFQILVGWGQHNNFFFLPNAKTN